MALKLTTQIIITYTQQLLKLYRHLLFRQKDFCNVNWVSPSPPLPHIPLLSIYSCDILILLFCIFCTYFVLFFLFIYSSTYFAINIYICIDLQWERAQDKTICIFLVQSMNQMQKLALMVFGWFVIVTFILFLCCTS